jgi:alkyl sulfatase BDS1-like metallo-beta-lactamase superfamily hydrolase
MRTTVVSLALMFSIPVVACAQPSEATRRLLERNKMFEPQIFEVADNVYTALGYQVSANTMIVGDDGVIIIDPGQQIPGGQQVRAAFAQITDLPVRAIIYTHGHGDHTTAAPVFYTEGAGIEVWARSNYPSEPTTVAARGYAGGVRASNTQGFDLPPEQKIGVGIAIPPERVVAGGINVGVTERPEAPPVIAPTHTFDTDRIRLEIAGVELELVAAPGETADQLYVWLPEQRVVFAGDNFYQSWPNVYPLRGTAQRSVRDWIESIDKMVQEEPLHLVGGHTAPIFDDAVEVLTNYRDAMQWVVDRTVAGARAFMTPDELVEYAALPDHLAELDYLGDYYGSVEGTVRTIYAQELGWFDGDPLNLHRESPVEQSQRIAELAGGTAALMDHARGALAADDPLGAAQFAQHVVRLEPQNAAAKLLMADALAVLGERTFNAPARNYTLSSSNRLRRAATQGGSP